MGESTAIAWTDHTFNPWQGCTKVSPGCDHCYAEALGKRTGRVEWGDAAARVPTSDAYWRNPLKWNRDAEAGVPGARGPIGRHLVFCASMADVFEDRPELDEQRARLFDLIGQTPALDWQLLTKRPENVMDMVPWGDGMATWPPNVWLGTTVEDEDRALERTRILDDIPAHVRFLSCEPLLGSLGSRMDVATHLAGIDWVIVGGESGPRHRPLNLDHARTIRDACVFLDIPFFFKQVGGRTPKAGGDLLDGETWKQFPTVAAFADGCSWCDDRPGGCTFCTSRPTATTGTGGVL
jgi:protein gp37